MRRVTLTGSGLWLAQICIGSAVLERASSTTPWTRRGNALHKFFLDVNRLGGPEAGRDAALALVEDDGFRRVCEFLNLEGLPLDPAAYVPEVALAYDVVTGRAEELHRKGDRDYSMVDFSRQVPITLDGAGVSPRRVKVFDWKPGFAYVSDPEINMQFRMGGLAAARTWGRGKDFEGAEVEMVRFREDGEPYTVRRFFDLFALAEIASEVRELHADGMRAAAADVAPKLTTGAHCAKCNSIAYCPAAEAVVRAAVTQPETVVVGMIAKLTPEHALEALDQYDSLVALVGRMKEELDRFAAWEPIRMRDGRMYGKHEEHRDKLDGQKVWHRLAELVGADEAWKASKIATTKKDLTALCGRIVDGWKPEEAEAAPPALRALVGRVLSRPSKRKGGAQLAKTPLNEFLIEDLKEVGALKTTYFESVGVFTPPKELKE